MSPRCLSGSFWIIGVAWEILSVGIKGFLLWVSRVEQDTIDRWMREAKAPTKPYGSVSNYGHQMMFDKLRSLNRNSNANCLDTPCRTCLVLAALGIWPPMWSGRKSLTSTGTSTSESIAIQQASFDAVCHKVTVRPPGERLWVLPSPIIPSMTLPTN